MKFDPEFLTVADILSIHELQMTRYGGLIGVRDQELLESAVAMPQAMFDGEYLHEDIFEMAAAYAFHIAQNQPFLDGNKRTGLLSALVFLDINDIQVREDSRKFYTAMIAIADKKMTKEQLSDLFRSQAS